MPAIVINGIFQGSPLNWTSVAFPGTFDGVAVVGNTSNQTQTYTGITLSGVNAADFSIDATQFPVVVNPNQTALLHVKFTSRAGAVSNALATVTTNSAFAPTFNLVGTQFGTSFAQPFPSFVGFPITKVGQTTTFTQAQIFNDSNASVTVNNIAMNIGTSYFIVGAPVVPFAIPAGGQSAIFSIQFSPVGAGLIIDQLIITPAAGNNAQATVAGTGSVLQSAFNLTGGVQGSLFALSGSGSPLVLLANPDSLNTEEPSSFVKLHDFGIPTLEKRLMRIRGHYEDLGAAVLMFTARARRIGQPDETIQVSVPIGTVFADGWIREFTSEPVPITGELIQLTGSRAGNSGPVSLIDYMPQFEQMGEVLGGT